MSILELFQAKRKVAELNESIAELEKRREALEESLSNRKTEYEAQVNMVTKKQQEIKAANDELAQLKDEINGINVMEEYAIPRYKEAKIQLEKDREEKQRDIEFHCKYTDGEDKDGLWWIESPYTLNNSTSKGKAMQKTYGEGLIYALNAYLDSKEKSVTYCSLNKTIDAISKKFNMYQKKAENIGLSLNSDYVSTRIDIMKLNLAIKQKEKEEKERIREEKQRMREEEKLAQEIAKIRASINADRLRYDKALGKATTEQERQEIKNHLAEIDKREQDINYREQHSRSGWLYVIDTPAMPGICKLGCTRRIDPLQRVAELSSASVPFPFICRAVVFSDDVFDIETKIHNYFNDKRVNKENLHKEFFAITPNEAITALKDVFGCEIHYISKQEQENVENEEI